MSDVGAKSTKRVEFPCGHVNPEEDLFCETCGAGWAAQCVRCHAVNGRTATVCCQCRSPLGGSPPEHLKRPAVEADADPNLVRLDRLERLVAERVRKRQRRRVILLASLSVMVGAGVAAAGATFMVGLGVRQAGLPPPRAMEPTVRSAVETDRPAPGLGAQAVEPARAAVPEPSPAVTAGPATEPSAPANVAGDGPRSSESGASPTARATQQADRRAALPPRPSIPPIQPAQMMAAQLVTTFGRDHAEQTATRNAARYQGGTPESAYWHGVAAAIRRGPGSLPAAVPRS